jgi:hypothetical protein
MANNTLRPLYRRFGRPGHFREEIISYPSRESKKASLGPLLLRVLQFVVHITASLNDTHSLYTLFVVVCSPGVTTHCGCIFTAR